MIENTTLARFGHHPEPAIDFCVEVEELSAIAESHELSLDYLGNAQEYACYADRYCKAMEFVVGGDQGAVLAKAMLRKLPERLT